MKETTEEKRWVLCPNCGAKTRLQLLPETELKAFPLFCPKCKHESIINIKHFNMETKHPKADENGFVLYYTDQCPYTYYWVPRVEEMAKEHYIPFKVIHITTKEVAQNAPAPVTTYALFRNGEFVTQSIQSDKKFLVVAGIEG